jgi:hypothetical protein
MPPSARHTLVVAFLPSDLALLRLGVASPFCSATSNPRCVVPKLNWISNVEVVQHRKAMASRVPGPIRHQRASLLPLLHAPPRLSKHATFSLFSDDGFCHLGFKASEFSKLAA